MLVLLPRGMSQGVCVIKMPGCCHRVGFPVPKEVGEGRLVAGQCSSLSMLLGRPFLSLKQSQSVFLVVVHVPAALNRSWWCLALW